jgi:hypothetical protein
MGRHGVPWRNDDHLLTQDPYADLDLLFEPRPRRTLGPILLGVAFVATVTAVIAGVHLLSGDRGDSGGSGGSPGRLGLAPACFSGTGCPSPGAAGRPTATHAAAAGLSPLVQEPTAVPSPHPTATPHATRDGGSGGTIDPPRASSTPTSGPGSAEPEPDQRISHKPASHTSNSDGSGSGGTGSDRTGTDRAGSGKATSARTGTGRPGTSVAPKRAVVKYTVLDRRFEQYRAEIAIGNNGDGDLRGLRVELPISGRVISVTGARAEQRGTTLVLVSTELLPSGGGIGVEVVVNGESVAPGDCSLAGGSCDVL